MLSFRARKITEKFPELHNNMEDFYVEEHKIAIIR
mgnify:CR=1 FL=1